MADITPLLKITNSNPITLLDNTNYFKAGTSWKIKPVVDTDVFTGESSLKIDRLVFTGDSYSEISINVNSPIVNDAIYDPLSFYEEIVSIINVGTTTNNIYAEINKNDYEDPIDFINWDIIIYSIGSDRNNAIVEMVRYLTELPYSSVYADYLSDGVQLLARTISLFNPCGTQIDLGEKKQKWSSSINYSFFDKNDIIYFYICNEQLIYEVPKDNQTRDCVFENLVNLINSSELPYTSKVCASYSNATLYIESRVAGIFFEVHMEYFDDSETIITPFDWEAIQINVPSIFYPISNNEINYIPNEVGGKYKAILTILSQNEAGCVYYSVEEYFSNWEYDITQLEECLVDMIDKSICECSDNSFLIEISSLRNKLYAISLMKETGYKYENIQMVIDSAKSICGKANCGNVDIDCGCGCK